MTSPKRLTLALVMLLALVAIACGTTPTTIPAATPTVTPEATPTPSLFLPLVITDSNGSRVTIEEPPQRVIVFDSAAVEILFAIGEGHRIAGTHAFVNYPPAAEGIPRVGDAFNMNFEKVLELRPDLVYIYFDRFLPDLERLGLKVLYIKSLNHSLQDVTDHVRLWGNITGNVKAAEALAAQFETRLEDLEERLAVIEEGPRLYDHATGFWTPGGDTLIGQIFTLLRAKNIAQDISSWAQISPEVVVQEDPEVVITTQDGMEELNGIAALQQVSAVKNGRVFVMPPDLLSEAGPRLIELIEDLARLLYPELF